MSNINPQGVAVHVCGEERHFLFDYAVIAEIQEAYDSDVLSVIQQLWMDRRSPGEYRAKILIDLTHKLLLDESEREKVLRGNELKVYTKREVGWLLTQKNADDIVRAILEAWTASTPETDEESDPNATRGSETTIGSTSPS